MNIFIVNISFRENSQTIESSGFIFNSSRIPNCLNKQFRPYTRENNMLEEYNFVTVKIISF